MWGRRSIVFLIIAIIFTGLFFRYMHRAPKRHYSDFRVYYAAGKIFMEKGNIYERPSESITPFKYFPMFAMLAGPLSFFSIKTASLIFFTINFILLIVIFIFSGKLIIKNDLPFKERAALYAATAFLSARVILHTLDSGQAGMLMLGLAVLGLYFLQEKREVLSAALIGLSIMVKYMPIIFIPYFLVKGKIKVAIFITLFVVLYCILPSAYVGIDRGTEYLKEWFPSSTQTSLDKNSWHDYKNQSLYSFSLRYFTKVSPYRASMASLTFGQGIFLSSLIGLILCLGVLFPGGRVTFNSPAADYSLLFILMVLLNPNAWMHNFVVLTFVYMALFYRLIKRGFKDRFLLAIVVLSFVLTTVMGELFVGDNLEKLFEEFSSLTIAALLLVVSLLKLKLEERHG